MRQRSLAAAAILALSGLPAAAQPYTPLPRHSAAPPPIVGEIEQSDPLDEQNRRYDEYVLELEVPHDLVISAETAPGSRISSVVKLYQPGSSRPAASSNDQGQPLSSSVDFFAARPGTYRIRVLGGRGTTGRYILRIAADPKGEGGAAETPAFEEVPRRAPNERFIICPGHRRCSR